MEIRSPPKLKFSQSLTTRHTQKKLPPHPPPPTKKIYLGRGGEGVYTMENKDTNADCQKVARGPKVLEVTIGIFFFFLLEIYIHYFLCKEFSSPT